MEDEKKVQDTIFKTLMDLKDEHNMSEGEVECLAALISAVAHSSPETRLVFFKVNYALANDIKRALGQQASAIMKEITAKDDDENKDPIMN